jgi:hypothetical protein
VGLELTVMVGSVFTLAGLITWILAIREGGPVLIGFAIAITFLTATGFMSVAQAMTGATGVIRRRPRNA